MSLSNSSNALESPEAGEDGDLSDLLGELRVLLLSAQLLTGFLITVPFGFGFGKIVAWEKWLFVATFAMAVASLVLFSAPAVQHRLLRPLGDRPAFKRLASLQTLAGSVCLSVALVLASGLVLTEALGQFVGAIAASVLALLIAAFWWCLPLASRARKRL
ncbi:MULTISPECIES: DUF6328 family protein [Acidovorax]|uniref:DUF6328 family protein n=1 Tax=Acidovorax facilis TaxID=12917 RepID=A0ABV8DI41_9BURK|nr:MULTISPECIES: DUF6328 family protein [Acidovorax]KQB60270.1 hypothetical protein AE621_06060 [Acidovorax sp. SD340]MBO1009610.1 hypothetical protein [Acidovorax sp. SD340]MCO4243733.1 DUF6328 family protein [Acidovorax facilis]